MNLFPDATIKVSLENGDEVLQKLDEIKSKTEDVKRLLDELSSLSVVIKPEIIS